MRLPSPASIAAFALGLGCVPAVSAAEVRAVEYFHRTFEHYFVTASSGEITALDTGQPDGWYRTSQRYRVDDAGGPGLAPVCRFLTQRFAGKASHFFTAHAAECAALMASADWTYEGIAFHVRPPEPPAGCPAGTAPVERLYNDGQGGAPNHAYSSDPLNVARLASNGWVREGIAWCVPRDPVDPATKVLEIAGTAWEFPESFWQEPSGVTRIQFRTNPASGSVFQEYASRFGFPSASAGLYQGWVGDSPWGGPVIFDPVAGDFLLAGGSGFEWYPYQGSAWTFAGASVPTQPACEHWVINNLASSEPYVPHPTQPILWTGCKPGSARPLP